MMHRWLLLGLLCARVAVMPGDSTHACMRHADYPGLSSTYCQWQRGPWITCRSKYRTRTHGRVVVGKFTRWPSLDSWVPKDAAELAEVLPR